MAQTTQVQVEDGPWVFDEETHSILHEPDMCTECKTWKDHYESGKPTLSFSEASDAHDDTIRAPLLSRITTLKKEYQEGLREAEALEREIFEVKREAKAVRQEEAVFKNLVSALQAKICDLSQLRQEPHRHSRPRQRRKLNHRRSPSPIASGSIL